MVWDAREPRATALRVRVVTIYDPGGVYTTLDGKGLNATPILISGYCTIMSLVVVIRRRDDINSVPWRAWSWRPAAGRVCSMSTTTHVAGHLFRHLRRTA